ncbi:isoprenoid synthase domain-containing protein [Phlebopus sp. FC_14]|nr:isoprenoid synthase domain-containing protein [Phlebopus sp. FC_14]
MNHSKFDNLLQELSISSFRWSAEQQLELLEPFLYIESCPSKEFRSQLIEAFNQWLQVPVEQLELITQVVRLLHNASLLVDDIEDDSELRRGRPAAHKVYGVPQTINAANYVYFIAYQELAKMDSFDVRFNLETTHEPKPQRPSRQLITITNEELLALHRGQGREILWRDSLRCPSEEEYIEMVQDKTGGLLRIAVRLMMACATKNADVNYVPLTDLIGIWFQIRDDYLNLQSNVYTEKKGFAEDLTEGKFSFPIVHGIREAPRNRQILSVLQQRPKSPTLKLHAIEYLKNSTHSFEYTLAAMRSLERQARSEVARLGGNVILETIFDALHLDDGLDECVVGQA